MKILIYTQLKTFLFLTLIAWGLSDFFHFTSAQSKDVNAYLYLGILAAVIVTAFFEHCVEITRSNTFHLYRYKPDMTMFYFSSLTKIIFGNYILNIAFMTLITQFLNAENSHSAYRINGETILPVFSYCAMISILLSVNLFNFSILKKIKCTYNVCNEDNNHAIIMRQINAYALKDIGQMFNNSTFTNLEKQSRYEKQKQAIQDAALAHFS